MANRAKLRFTPLARQDIADVLEYYKSIRPELGRQFMRRLITSLDLIIDRPTSFPVIQADIRRAALDQFPYGVFFFEFDGFIRVIAIVDLRRDESVWRRRR
jgi:plasmid stabilization system protein ParE